MDREAPGSKGAGGPSRSPTPAGGVRLKANTQVAPQSPLRRGSRSPGQVRFASPPARLTRFNPSSPPQEVNNRGGVASSDDGSSWQTERARRFGVTSPIPSSEDGFAGRDGRPGFPPYRDRSASGSRSDEPAVQPWRPRGKRGSGWQKKKGKGKGGSGRGKGNQKGGGAAGAPAPKWGAKHPARIWGARKAQGKKDSGGGGK